jgi:hypothetical protein
VIRQRLPSENMLGPVMLTGDKAWMMFVSPISALVQNLADAWV